MVTVCIWSFRGKDVAWGHASMLVRDTYMSWWPEGRGRIRSRIHPNIYEVNPIRGRSFEDDVRDEEGKPDHDIRLEGLDESAILDWWQSFGLRRGEQEFQGPTLSWSTLDRNCSTVVATGLKKGGSDRYAAWLPSWNLVWTPKDVLEYALSIQRGLQKRGR